MKDNKKKIGIPDSKLISLQQPYEVKYWMKRFRVSRRAIETAISETGSHGVAKVEKWLTEKGFIK